MVSKDKIFLSVTDLLTISSFILISVFFSDYLDLKQELENEALLLNNTQNANQSMLVYNRVPKAASETLWFLIQNISLQNGFTSYNDDQDLKAQRGHENVYLGTDLERMHYVHSFVDSGLSYPLTYTKHFFFLDFQEFNFTNPIYINLVRDPIDRVNSWYYYIRANEQVKENDDGEVVLNRNKMFPPVFYKRSFEECVNEKLGECVFELDKNINGDGALGRGGHVSQIAFFCGNHDFCRKFGNRQALNLAKENVEKYYAVVGIVERFSESLDLLEHYIPAYFTGIKNLHQENLNVSRFKPKTPKYIRNLLLSNFTVEMEFYEFCKQRFQKQLLAIK